MRHHDTLGTGNFPVGLLTPKKAFRKGKVPKRNPPQQVAEPACLWGGMSCEDWTTFDLARECSWPHLLYVQACVGRGCTSAASLACFGVTEHPLTSKTKGAGFLALDWFSESHNHFLRGLFLHCLRSDWVILFVPCHKGPRRVGYITCRCKCAAICWKTK